MSAETIRSVRLSKILVVAAVMLLALAGAEGIAIDPKVSMNDVCLRCGSKKLIPGIPLKDHIGDFG